MFKVFKLILNINIERKVCSHHTVQFCETEQKPIRYDVNMVLIKGVYKWIFFVCITPSNSFVPFTVFLPDYSLHIFISWGISQSGISSTTDNKLVSKLVGYLISTCTSPKTFPFKTSFENFAIPFWSNGFLFTTSVSLIEKIPINW